MSTLGGPEGWWFWPRIDCTDEARARVEWRWCGRRIKSSAGSFPTCAPTQVMTASGAYHLPGGGWGGGREGETPCTEKAPLTLWWSRLTEVSDERVGNNNRASGSLFGPDPECKMQGPTSCGLAPWCRQNKERQWQREREGEKVDVFLTLAWTYSVFALLRGR